MSFTSYQVARVWGIPIKLHLSLLIMVFIFARHFGWVNGLLLEVGLGVSIILHELGHSLVAIRKGCRVRQITLMCMGGAAQMERIPERPLDEFQMAIAGPLVSLALAVVLIPLGAYLPVAAFGYEGLNLIQLVGYMNASLVVFNLLPAFPMDGGRVLRAALTPRFGRLRATATAARLGQIMAFLFGLYGLMPPANYLLVAIAFLVYNAAGAEYRMVQVQEHLRRGMAPPWPFVFHRDPPDGADDATDRVIVSPPPYARGPETETEVRPEPGRRGWFT